MQQRKCKDLVIVAAGNASRMGQLPKAASLINGVPNIYNLVRGCYNLFEQIHVVSNAQYRDLYSEILKDFEDRTKVIDIVSGKGCGDAIYTVLSDERFSLSEETVFCWGDTFFTDFRIFEELIEQDMKVRPMLIPIRMEKDPYAWFEREDIFVKRVRFKKRGHQSNGYSVAHDQSLFKLNVNFMGNSLQNIRNVTWDGDLYLNGEMTFLDCCSYLYNCQQPAQIYLTEYDSFSYNTPEELAAINRNAKK